MAVSSTPFLAFLGLLFIGFAFANLINNITKANQLSELKQVYEQHRTAILREIRDCEFAHGKSNVR
jgi:hypothetical protein